MLGNQPPIVGHGVHLLCEPYRRVEQRGKPYSDPNSLAHSDPVRVLSPPSSNRRSPTEARNVRDLL
jgi:hypothetical protein